MKVVTVFNNFSRGRIDHDMMGRFDLPIYASGSDVFENFISNFKGNAIYRTGFESIQEFQDCEFVEFKFSDNQNYLLLFYANKIRFMSYDVNGNFGWVLDGGMAILEVATPYSLAECRNLDYTQNADVMVFTVQGHQPRKLIRTSANSFTFNTFSRKDDPFGLTYAATKVITAITQAANAQVSVAAHGYVVGDMVKIAGVVGMTQINGYTARVVSTPTAGTFTIDVDTTTFTAYGSAGTTALLLTGSYPACCLFYKGRLYYANTAAKITTVWASESANYDIFTLPVTVLDTSALQFTIADISQQIEWLFGGDNSLIVGSASGIVAVNGGSVGAPITAETVEATLTTAQPASSVYPLGKDGFIFYPANTDRNLNYFAYDLLSERFVAEDANFISYDITRGGLGKIRYKKDRNDLIYAVRGDGNLLSLNFNAKEKIIGWHTHMTEGSFKQIAVITDNEGKPQLFSLTERNGDYFVERQAEFVEFAMRSEFFTNAKAVDEEAYNRYVAEQLRDCVYLDNALKVNNLKSNSITYDPIGGTITATNPVFSLSDEGKHIQYKTLTGYENGRFEIVNYVSTTVVEVEVLQTPTTNTYTDWYLSFTSISGLSQFNGQTVGVVTDGGYLTDFEVTGGAISFTKPTCSAVVGYKYRGLIKSFCLGFQAGAENTQTTMKAVCRAGVRTVASAGGKIGTSPYKLEPVQLLKQGGLNYLPPPPMDGTNYVTYTDDNREDKFFYIVQDEPLPLQVCAMMLDTQYTVTR